MDFPDIRSYQLWPLGTEVLMPGSTVQPEGRYPTNNGRYPGHPDSRDKAMTKMVLVSFTYRGKRQSAFVNVPLGEALVAHPNIFGIKLERGETFTVG